MFTEFIPNDRPTAFFEIGIILLITFILGFICAKIPLGKKEEVYAGSSPEDIHFEERDIITEPTTIRATLTRERGGTLADKKAITSNNDKDNSIAHEEEE